MRPQVYDKTRSVEVVPEMRGALDRACTSPSFEEFAKDLELEAPLDDGIVAGLP